MKLISSFVLSSFACLSVITLLVSSALSQIQPPDRRYLFESDRNLRANKIQQRQRSKERRDRIKQKSERKKIN